MARRKLPDRPPNGIGAGERPSLRPLRLNTEEAYGTLTRPFKVPLKVDKSKHSERYGVRASRRAATVYAGMDEGDMEKVGVKRVDALSSIRLARDTSRLEQIENTLKRSFTVPIKGYVQRHNIPLALGMKIKITPPPRPLHDPSEEFAIVLYDPTVDGDIREENINDVSGSEDVQRQEKTTGPAKRTLAHPERMSNGVRNKSLRELLGSPDNKSKKFPCVPVVLDPKLAKILRPHQVEGVRFLYRCVTGLAMKDFLDAQNVLKPLAASAEHLSSSPTEAPVEEAVQNAVVEKNRGAYGCIMADEMGLGKTLQCIALLWSLLRQGAEGKATIDKCIIVCPSSLVNNWANEIVKWLGPNTLSPLAIDGKKNSLSNGSVAMSISQWALAQGRNIVKPVLIISYETLRRNIENLKGCKVGLMLADEGHRLKNGDSLTFTSLDSINCPRRVILSGTPIQNDLSEYFALLSFSNPGLLGTRAQFRKDFEIPILRGRDADATEKEIEEGELKLQQLSQIVSKFIIRRTNDILSKYLPCKYEHVIFVSLSPLQKALYEHFVKSREVAKLVKGTGSQPLKAIGLLKKLCNHPDLLDLPDDIEGSNHLLTDYQSSTSTSRNSRGASYVQTCHSSKFAILERFLYKIRTESSDKIVLISNYTQTLDLIEKMCRFNHYGVLRLDGTMNINKRQKLVDKFNKPDGDEFIFLLSSKAGGCGINLIGANRLILLDPDWNPAADQQALARVWRDGQKKDCFIYRFISTGTIEEKIYQRQSMKMSLSSCVVDEKEHVERLFSSDNLKQLFQFDAQTICDTHTTYNCKRCKNGKQITKAPAMLYGDATTWNHLNHSALSRTNDHLLKNEYNFNDISYVFQYISH
ncbi:HFL047Cp [Eremothecium sinecaudum]|uniref:DNA helicase n=1 Tax=Eremothecium sinecaudum TaxID=45286 RepID=A0A0X8HUL8_9SACH|nr:HFL047Cp [Eremothecium sinecaudum]AMD21809.1 HFL047Cp [Eremothecium sinecaudum]